MCHTINVGQLDFIGNSCGCWRRIGDRAQFTCLLSSEKKVKCLRLIRQCFTTDQTKGQILDYGHTTRVVIVLSVLFFPSSGCPKKERRKLLWTNIDFTKRKTL